MTGSHLAMTGYNNQSILLKCSWVPGLRSH